MGALFLQCFSTLPTFQLSDFVVAGTAASVMANSLWGSTSATWHLMEKAMLGCSSMLIFDYKGWDACILGGHEFGETMSSTK